MEHHSASYYTFLNKSAFDIELKLCHKEKIDTTYYITAGDRLTLIHPSMPRIPLVLGENLDAYIIVSNGTTEITQYFKDKTGLYDHGNYKRVRYEPSKKSSSIWYEYEFTDAFFEQDTTE